MAVAERVFEKIAERLNLKYDEADEEESSLLGLEAVVVSGGNGKAEGGHIWNQVLIDGTWYNADLTYQMWSIQEKMGKEYCLVADDKIEYRTDVAFGHKCMKDYGE